MVDSDDNQSMSSNANVALDDKDPLTKEIFHTKKTMNYIEEIDEDKYDEDGSVLDNSYDSGSN